MKRVIRLLSAAALAVSATGVAALTATPAHAALPNCNRYDYVGSGPQTRIPTFNGNRDCVMGSGNVSDGVWALQYTLVYCYGQNIGVDRVFGAQTRTALINVQRRVGASADGVYGPATRSRMVWAYVAGPTNGCTAVG